MHVPFVLALLVFSASGVLAEELSIGQSDPNISVNDRPYYCYQGDQEAKWLNGQLISSSGLIIENAEDFQCYDSKATRDAGKAVDQWQMDLLLTEESPIRELSIDEKNLFEKLWDTPPSALSNLSATVKVKLNPDGSVDSVAIANSSGSLQFDKSVLEAVYRDGTFDPSMTDFMLRFKYQPQ